MHYMYVIASTVADSVDDEETKLRQAQDKLGPDWTVQLGVAEPTS